MKYDRHKIGKYLFLIEQMIPIILATDCLSLFVIDIKHRHIQKKELKVIVKKKEKKQNKQKKNHK